MNNINIDELPDDITVKQLIGVMRAQGNLLSVSIISDPNPKLTREQWINKELDTYQKYYNGEVGKYYIEHDWHPTLDELKADLSRSYDDLN